MVNDYDENANTCSLSCKDMGSGATSRYNPENPFFDQGNFPGQSADTMRMPVATGMLDVGTEGQDLNGIKDTKKRLAKRANQIYRSVCDELALKECFFYGFGAWSEFVDGKISENRFYEKAKAEARHIVEKQNG